MALLSVTCLRVDAELQEAARRASQQSEQRQSGGEALHGAWTACAPPLTCYITYMHVPMVQRRARVPQNRGSDQKMYRVGQVSILRGQSRPLWGVCTAQEPP